MIAKENSKIQKFKNEFQFNQLYLIIIRSSKRNSNAEQKIKLQILHHEFTMPKSVLNVIFLHSFYMQERLEVVRAKN